MLFKLQTFRNNSKWGVSGEDSSLVKALRPEANINNRCEEHKTASCLYLSCEVMIQSHRNSRFKPNRTSQSLVREVLLSLSGWLTAVSWLTYTFLVSSSLVRPQNLPTSNNKTQTKRVWGLHTAGECVLTEVTLEIVKSIRNVGLSHGRADHYAKFSQCVRERQQPLPAAQTLRTSWQIQGLQ